MRQSLCVIIMRGIFISQKLLLIIIINHTVVFLIIILKAES